MKKSNLFKRILAYTLVFAVLLSQMVFAQAVLGVSAEDSVSVELPVWSGKKASGLSDMVGDGSVENPYQIATAEQLAYVVSTNLTDGLCFKLVSDIRINDTSKANWKDSAKNWVWADVRFVGTLDGDGHTIDGLYFKGSQKRVGLIAYIGDSVVKNLKFTNAYIYNTTSEEGVGIVVGQNSAASTYTGIYIDKSCELHAPNAKGVAAITARGNFNVSINNCAVFATITGGSHVGTFFGTYWGGTLSLYDCISGTPDAPVSPAWTIKNKANNYGVVSDSNGTIVLTADAMKGEAAKTNMELLDFENTWQTVEDDYPVLRPNAVYRWDGTKAYNFAGGSGTAEDPFLIEDAAQLYKMVVDYSKQALATKPETMTYFSIVEDIDLLGKQWYTTSLTSYPNDGSKFNNIGFSGVIYGNGHTIKNLNSNVACSTPGLIPVATHGTEIHDLHLENVNIPKAAWNNYAGAALIGMARGVANSKPIIIEGCSIKNATVASRDASAGFVGYLYSQSVTIRNSFIVDSDISVTATSGSTAGAFIGVMSGNDYGNAIVIENSHCGDLSPLTLTPDAFKAITTYSGVYTSNADYDNSLDGVLGLEPEEMKGEEAKDYMADLDFNNVWETVENGYPVLIKNIWDGKNADSFAGGTGTAEDPFLIENGSQLYKMVAEYSNNDVSKKPADQAVSQKYFKITKDINLGFKTWYTNGVGNWFSNANYNNVAFNGVIYGEGHTISGLSDVGVRSNGAVGLIPVATQGAAIYDLHLESGSMLSESGSKYAAGAFIGLAKGASGSAPIIIDGCSVKNFTIDGVNAAAAFVGYTYSQSITIKDCYCAEVELNTTASSDANAAAFIAVTGGNDYDNHIVIETSHSADISPIILSNDAFKAITTFKNVYTADEDYDDSIDGLTLVDVQQMVGDDAKSYLVGFNFNQIWQLGEEGEYPSHIDAEQMAQVWNGETAKKFEDGTGTEEDPYLISDASQLSLLVNAGTDSTKGKYYKLTGDINVSNVYEGWENDNPYVWGKKTAYMDGFAYSNSFAGTLDGAGYTVSGLYFSDEITDNGTYAYGLIPFVSANAVIKNIKVENVVADVEGSAYVGAVVGAAHVTEEDAKTPINMVQFVGVTVADTDLPILDAASRGVKFELCTADVLIGAECEKISIRNCNTTDVVYDENVLIYNASNADSEMLVNIRKYLLDKLENYITDINADSNFNIKDLISAKKALLVEPSEEYALVWAEEFNGDALNHSVWTESSSMSKGTTLQYANNTDFNEGKLTLSCNETDAVDQNGNKIYEVNKGLSTEKSMSFKYGKLEMRAKIPFGAGAFPSLWLTSRGSLGYNSKTSAYSTEVDVFEVFGDTNSENRAIACIHKWYNNEKGVKTGDECSCGSDSPNEYIVPASLRSKTFSAAEQNEFHIFTFEWDENSMKFAVDGEVYYTVSREYLESINFDIEGYDTDAAGFFEQFLCVRLNNHMYTVGEGAAYKYQGAASEIDASALNYEIDYIRLYQKNDGKSQIIFK